VGFLFVDGHKGRRGNGSMVAVIDIKELIVALLLYEFKDAEEEAVG